MRSLFLIVATVWLALSVQAMAAEALPVGDPVVEARVKKLSEELRCLTCMGQSIADSQSGFSDDMRREMREMIGQGKTDAQIMEFMVQRYGDFVLYRPPVKSTTWLLWFGPFLFFALGLGVLIIKLKKRTRTADEAVLTEEDHVRAARLLKESKENEA